MTELEIDDVLPYINHLLAPIRSNLRNLKRRLIRKAIYAGPSVEDVSLSASS